MQVLKQEAIESSRDNPSPEAYRNVKRKRVDRERSTVGTASALHTCYQTGWQSGCTANEKLGVTHMEGKWDHGVEACLPFAPAQHAWTSQSHPQQMNIVPRDPGMMCTALTDCLADCCCVLCLEGVGRGNAHSVQQAHYALANPSYDRIVTAAQPATQFPDHRMLPYFDIPGGPQAYSSGVLSDRHCDNSHVPVAVQGMFRTEAALGQSQPQFHHQQPAALYGLNRHQSYNREYVRDCPQLVYNFSQKRQRYDAAWY